MKSIIKTITVRAKNVMMAVVLVTISIVSSVQASATEKSKNAEPLPIEVKMLGSKDQQPLIQVNIANENAEEGKIVLVDENGDVIFTDSFQSKVYSKIFQLNTGADYNDMKIKIILSSKNEKKAQVYQITNKTRTVEEVVVSQL